MDEEDLAEAEEARKLSTKESYSGLGSTEGEISRRAPLIDIFRPSGETMGVKLLRKMGWRDGQGIGPRVRRIARLDDGTDVAQDGGEKHLFAPENSKMISFMRKDDRKGLGLQGSEKLETSTSGEARGSDEEEQDLSASKNPKKKPASRKSGFGVGILNDTGSDDEDPYSLGPKITYNKVMGGDKKTKKKKKQEAKSTISSSNYLVHNRPVFISKTTNKTISGFRKCHDGLLPLEGFILSTTIPIAQENKYPPPTIPAGWKSSKIMPLESQTESTYISTKDLAQSSTLDPLLRGNILGEASLPGKSVFDFMKPDARARIVSLTKNESLPAAGSEAPSSAAVDPASLVPMLDPAIASAALGRGVAGFVPYADNPAKLQRYRTFLSYRANMSDAVPERPKEITNDEWQRELHEFVHAATIFKPMTGVMASRFTSSSSGPQTSANPASEDNEDQILSTPPATFKDPAEEAAAMGMFGPMTRSSTYFYPSRLLCKRFNVPVPTHVHSESEGTSASKRASDATSTAQTSSNLGLGFGSPFQSSGFQTTESKKDLVTAEDITGLIAGAGLSQQIVNAPRLEPAQTIDPERNEALESARPGEEVFKAIFGSDSEDE